MLKTIRVWQENHLIKLLRADFTSNHNLVAKTNKIAYLDGLRGLAAVIVVFWHFFMVFYPATANGNLKISHIPFGIDAWLYNSPLSFFYNGDFAVSIFFVLSGYVLTKQYFFKKEKNILVKRVLARYPRLFFPSALSMLFAHFLLYIGAYQVFFLKNGANEILNYAKEFSLARPFSHMVKNIFFGIYFGDPEVSKILNTVLWTMGIEFKGSLLVLSIAFFINEIKHKNIITCAIAVLITIFSHPYGIYYAAFLAGMLFAANDIKPKCNSLLFLLLLISLYLGGYFEDSQAYLLLSHHSLIDKIGIAFRLYHTLGAILFVYCTLKFVWLHKLFNSSVLTYLGKISFCLYLMHQPIIYSLSCWIVLTGVGGYNFSVFIAFIAMIVTSWLIAHLMTQTVDKFSIRASSSFAKAVMNAKVTV